MPVMNADHDDAMDMDIDPSPPPPPPATIHHQEPSLNSVPQPPPPPPPLPSSASSAHSTVLSTSQPLASVEEHDDPSSSAAGPSRLPFYAMSSREGPPHLRVRLHPTQDLISRLGLLPAFDEMVRPYIRVPVEGEVDEKGKGKAVESMQMQGMEQKGVSSLPLGGGNKKEPEKHEKGWRGFATKVSGRFSSKKDTYLGTLVSQEARPRLTLSKFETSTLNGFIMEEGQLDPASLQELGMLPEDKHKKKKPKKLPDGGPIPPGAAPNAASSSGASPAAGARPSPRPNGQQTAAPSPRPTVHPAYVNSTRSPFPQQPIHPPSQQQIPAGQPRIVNGAVAAPPSPAPGTANGNHWRGQVVPPANGAGPSANGAVNGKASKVRKERDDGAGTSGTTAGQAAAAGPPRPHKKRKTDAPSPNQPQQPPLHGLPPHRQQQQPMQQATPTF